MRKPQTRFEIIFCEGQIRNRKRRMINQLPSSPSFLLDEILLISCFQEKVHGLIVLKESYPFLGCVIRISDSEKTGFQQQSEIFFNKSVTKPTRVHNTRLFCSVLRYFQYFRNYFKGASHLLNFHNLRLRGFEMILECI